MDELGASNKKHLLGGMLSLEEIKEWANTIEAQSTSKLIKFSHDPARSVRRAENGIFRLFKIEARQLC